jgi:hypothetical protein
MMSSGSSPLNSRQAAKFARKSAKQVIAASGIQPSTRQGNKELDHLLKRLATDAIVSAAQATKLGEELGRKVVELSQSLGRTHLDRSVIRQLILNGDLPTVTERPVETSQPQPVASKANRSQVAAASDPATVSPPGPSAIAQSRVTTEAEPEPVNPQAALQLEVDDLESEQSEVLADEETEVATAQEELGNEDGPDETVDEDEDELEASADTDEDAEAQDEELEDEPEAEAEADVAEAFVDEDIEESKVAALASQADDAEAEDELDTNQASTEEQDEDELDTPEDEDNAGDDEEDEESDDEADDEL